LSAASKAAHLALGAALVAAVVTGIVYAGRWLGIDLASPWAALGVLLVTVIEQNRRADTISERLDVQSTRMNSLEDRLAEQEERLDEELAADLDDIPVDTREEASGVHRRGGRLIEIHVHSSGRRIEPGEITSLIEAAQPRPGDAS